MPKRNSLHADTANSARVVPDAMAKKTERSHEENQERAYIAASRRQDRSIEARVQSARMASEIHKKRTGKLFRITEDVVRKEEMYEEEEDDLPRSYRVLNPNMQTESPEFNARIEAWMTNRLAMSRYMQRANDEWNDNHINRLFAQSFPQANQQAQQITRQMSMSGPNGHTGAQSPPFSAHAMSPASPTFPSSSHNRSGSLSTAAPTHGDGVSPVSPNSAFHEPSTPQQLPASPAPFAHDQSAFTAELPAEMKMMMGMEMNPPYAHNFYNQNWNNMGDGEGLYTGGMPSTHITKLDELDTQPEMFGDESWQQPMGEEPAWDTFLNDNEWSTDQ